MAEGSTRSSAMQQWHSLKKHTRVLRRLSALKDERSSWDDHWKEISEYFLPRGARFFVDDRNRGDKRHKKILDNTGIRALDTLSAGLMAGMTSPSRPWFRLTTSDPELDESDAVKTWLSKVTTIMQMIFAKSNTYRALHTIYEELGAFGTAASLVLEDFDNVIHCYPIVCGEYCISTDDKGYVDTLSREFQMTVNQMVRHFGLSAVSRTVRNLYDNFRMDDWITVYQLISPRKSDDHDPLKRSWTSVYLEAGSDEDKFLRESGFREFPGLCPRWTVSGGDIYGTSPAMRAIGDEKQLQVQQLLKSIAMEKMINPALQAPTSLKNLMVNTNPGGITFADSASQSGIRPINEIRIDLSQMTNDIQDVRHRIDRAMFADVFLMLSNADMKGLTATEVAERHEEKMLMIGPVLERLHNEILDPLIERTFGRMIEVGIVPPPPEELQGMTRLNVEFISMLAQAQKAVATNSVDRFVVNLGMIAQMKPDVLDKIDVDFWADSYADMLGVNPKLIVPGERVALIRKQRAEAQQQMQQAAMLQQGADVAAKLGSVDTSRQNALTDMTQQFSGL
ncbi:MAG: hypothetical protein LBJ59_12255 [Zoogloeaceae bacterium]|jgi:hypothetical protein|nr:hypothetical protein [Zoogloeaceae bacterium]